MSSYPKAQSKIVSADTLQRLVRQAQSRGKKVVFTNGCFDLLHAGHIKLLERSRSLGDLLIVGINGDSSVRRLKGPWRPILHQKDRALLLAALACVDYVTVFSEATPQRLIAKIKPKVLVKGADWNARHIVGREVVERNGGRVIRIPLLKGHSTTNLVERIRKGQRAAA